MNSSNALKSDDLVRLNGSRDAESADMSPVQPTLNSAKVIHMSLPYDLYLLAADLTDETEAGSLMWVDSCDVLQSAALPEEDYLLQTGRFSVRVYRGVGYQPGALHICLVGDDDEDILNVSAAIGTVDHALLDRLLSAVTANVQNVREAIESIRQELSMSI